MAKVRQTKAQDTFTLHDLAARVKERAAASPKLSYTRALLDKGVGHCAKKMGEEAVEAVLAAVSEDRGRLISETADLLYHLLVVLHARKVRLTEVEAALAARLGKSGLEEKAARKDKKAARRKASRAKPKRKSKAGRKT